MTIVVIESALFYASVDDTSVKLQHLAEALPEFLRPAFLAEPGNEGASNAFALEHIYPSGTQGVAQLLEQPVVESVARQLVRSVPSAPLVVVLSCVWSEADRRSLITSVTLQRSAGAAPPMVFVVKAGEDFDELRTHFNAGAT
jgi:hypothetical protein